MYRKSVFGKIMLLSKQHHVHVMQLVMVDFGVQTMQVDIRRQV